MFFYKRPLIWGRLLEQRINVFMLSAPDLPHATEVQAQNLARWFLAYTKPRFESVAQVNLQQQGFDVYLPMYKKFKTTETGSVSVFEPMFPRYLFIL